MKPHTLADTAARPAAEPTHPIEATEVASAVSVRQFGLPTASALVVGSVIGTGVFALPSALASYGPISLVAFGLVTVGALALALTFRALTGRLPFSGGPYVYARDAFGDFAGFLNAWSYWITAWAGNAAIVVAWVGYVEVFWNSGHAKGWSIVIALIGLWLPASDQPGRAAQHRLVPDPDHVVKFIPLLFIATVGLFFIKSRELRRIQRQRRLTAGRDQRRRGHRLVQLPRHRDGIGGGRAGARPAAQRRPGDGPGHGRAARSSTSWERSSCSARSRTAGSSARPHPFTDSANAIFGGRWAGNAVAIAAIVSGIGALVGWTLIVAEMPQAAARDRLFPARFARESRAGVPAFGIIVSTLLASALTVVSYTSFDKVFTTIVLLSVLDLGDPVPLLRRRPVVLAGNPPAGRDIRGTWSATSSSRRVALVFSFWTLAGSGYQAVYYGVFFVLLGVPVYVWMKTQARRVRRDARRPGDRRRWPDDHHPPRRLDRRPRLRGRAAARGHRAPARAPNSTGSPRRTPATCSSTTCMWAEQGPRASTTRSPTCCASTAPACTCSPTCWPRRSRYRQAATFALDRICTDDRFGPTLARDLRKLLDDTAPAELAELLIGGIVKSDLQPAEHVEHDLAEPGDRRLRPAAAAEHAVPARQRGLDRPRRHDQPDGQSRRDDANR